MTRAVTRHRPIATVQTKKPDARAKQPRTVGADTGMYLAQAFSDIELLVAADVLKAAISEGRKHVDLEALRSVLAKLTAAYDWKKRARE
jgi:hypothetical protein